MALPVINYFNASPPFIPSGGNTTLSWGVTDATTVTIDPGLGTVGLVGTAPVSPGTTTNYTLTATNAAGWHSVTLTVMVGPAPPPASDPDLIITDIIRSGSTISYVIKNQGTATAAPSTSQLTVDGVIKATDAVGPLSAGVSSTESFSYSYTCTGTSDSLAVQADKSNVIAESNEGNNARTESSTCMMIAVVTPGIVLTFKPDLIITDIWRDANKIRYRIKNQGLADAGPSQTRLVVDGAIKTVDGVGALPAGAETAQVFSGYSLPLLPFHTFQLKVVADKANAIDETDETNNVRGETTHW
jgi:subtilase family serine protease